MLQIQYKSFEKLEEKDAEKKKDGIHTLSIVVGWFYSAVFFFGDKRGQIAARIRLEN